MYYLLGTQWECIISLSTHSTHHIVRLRWADGDGTFGTRRGNVVGILILVAGSLNQIKTWKPENHTTWDSYSSRNSNSMSSKEDIFFSLSIAVAQSFFFNRTIHIWRQSEIENKLAKLPLCVRTTTMVMRSAASAAPFNVPATAWLTTVLNALLRPPPNDMLHNISGFSEKRQCTSARMDNG